MTGALTWTALVLYAAATAACFAFLLWRDERWGGWSHRLLGAGIIAQGAALAGALPAYWAAAACRYRLPVDTAFGALTLLCLAVAATFLAVERRRRLGILGAFVLPWTVVFCGVAALSSPVASAGAAQRAWWADLHPLLLMGAYASFVNAAGVALAWLVQERQLKSRAPAPLCYRLPALERLDDLHFLLVSAGAAQMLAGLALGGLWAREAWTPPYAWDPKVVGSGVTAAGYGLFLYMRLVRGWRGRRALVLAMSAFGLLALTFLGGDALSRVHGFLHGAR